MRGGWYTCFCDPFCLILVSRYSPLTLAAEGVQVPNEVPKVRLRRGVAAALRGGLGPDRLEEQCVEEGPAWGRTRGEMGYRDNEHKGGNVLQIRR